MYKINNKRKKAVHSPESTNSEPAKSRHKTSSQETGMDESGHAEQVNGGRVDISQNRDKALESVTLASVHKVVLDLSKHMQEVTASIKDSLNFYSADIKENQEHITELGRENKALKQHMVMLNARVNELQTVKDKNLQLEQFLRRNNIVFDGIPETKNENCVEKLHALFVTTLKIPHGYNIEIESAMRIGRISKNMDTKHAKSQSRPRVIHCRFFRFNERQQVWNNRFYCRETSVWVNEDLPTEISNDRKLLTPAYKAALKLKLKPKMVGNKLIIGSESYSVNTIHRLPPNLRTAFMSETKNDSEVVYISKRDNPFSPIYPVNFRVDDITFKCIEQYVQYRKAELHNKEVTAASILSTDDTIMMYRRGHTITTGADWGKLKTTIQKVAVTAVYEQNPYMLDFLKSTGEKPLVACLPIDPEWSCGMYMKNPTILQSGTWKSDNILGTLLEEVRSMF